MSAASDHCLELVRKGDKDRFLSSLFAPDDKRPHLLALYAFNLEITRIRDAVSEPQIGLIRQQWWRDTLDSIYLGAVPAHPVAEALARAIEAGDLPKHALQNLVTAREFDLFHDRMENLAQLEGYLGETSSVLIQMASLILAGPAAKVAAEAAGLAGVAYGLALALRDPRRREPFLPASLPLAEAIIHARKRLDDSRALRSAISDEALPAFLPVSLTSLYLGRIGRAPNAPADISQFRRQLTLWWYARQDRF